MTTALATVSQGTSIQPNARLAYEPSDVESALRLCQILAESRLLPRGIATAEAAFTIAMTGRELGLTTMQSIRSLRMESGRIQMSADLMVALCLRESDVCERFQLVESNGKIATYEAKRVGQEPVRMSFTLEQAKQAGLLGKDNWKAYPDAMLRARCIAALARVVFPDLMFGIYDTDEIAPKENRIPARVAAVDVVPDEDFDAVAEEKADETATAVVAAIAAFGEASTLAALSGQRTAFAALKLRISADQKSALRAAYDEASARLSATTTETTTTEAA